MVDSIHSLFSCHRRFLREAKPRTRRSKAQETAVAIDHSQVAMAEAHDGAAALVFSEADEFACERLADENALAVPLDLSGVAHATNLMIGIVPRILQPGWHRAGWRLPLLSRRRLVDRLVRALLIVISAKRIEAFLLLARRGRRWLRGLVLQRPMHALVPAIILWARRWNVARLDVERDRPHRER